MFWDFPNFIPRFGNHAHHILIYLVWHGPVLVIIRGEMTAGRVRQFQIKFFFNYPTIPALGVVVMS